MQRQTLHTPKLSIQVERGHALELMKEKRPLPAPLIPAHAESLSWVDLKLGAENVYRVSLRGSCLLSRKTKPMLKVVLRSGVQESSHPQGSGRRELQQGLREALAK